MTQRLTAAFVAVPMVLALLVTAWWKPLPYVTYQPGPTVDVLAETDGQEIVQVQGAKTYRDDGQLRMTTVSVSRPRSRINLYTLMANWFDGEDAVYPYDAVYPDDETPEQNEAQDAVAMVSSQDTAIAVALAELDYAVEPAVKVLYIEPSSPADGELKVRDIFLSANGEPVTSSADLVEAVKQTPAGEKVTFVVQRSGTEVTVRVEPREEDGEPRIGIRLGGGYVFPIDVAVNIDPEIGGPSAGLMFSLAIYDTLTPGSLTGGKAVAGTGTIDGEGRVGPIGGIQQKIVGASGDGAELFLVPPDNCEEALGAQNGDMRLVKAETMHDAVTALEDWAEDPDAPLPTCGTSALKGASR